MTSILHTSNPRLRLRFAAQRDTEVILDLIRNLAEFERLAHEVVTDATALRRSLFGDRRVAEVVLAEYGDQPAGFALFFHNFSTFLGKPGLYCEDLFVKPEFRRKGIGKELLSSLARIAVDRDCGRLEWSVLDWNEAAIRFFRNLGGASMDEWTVFRLAGRPLRELAHADPTTTEGGRSSNSDTLPSALSKLDR